MKGLIAEIEESGVTIARFLRVSDLTYPTVRRIDRGDPSVKASTIAKARDALERIKRQRDPSVSNATG